MSNLRLPWKTELPWNFLLYWNNFINKDFWATCLCPENRVCTEFTVLNIYFLSFRKFEQLALALKTEFALKFFKPGQAAAPPPHPRLPCSKSLDADKFYQKQAKKHYFCLALILTHWLFPNAGTPPPDSTEPTVRHVTSFDYWQSVHCRIKAQVSQSRNMSGQH